MELKNLIASGPDVEVYEMDNLAVKVFKDHMPKTAALYEALTHARVETTGINMPIIREVTVVDGKWAIAMDLIKGKTLADLMKENPDKIAEYIGIMVDLQLDIHTKSMPLLSKLKDKMIRMIKSLDSIDEIKKYELLTRLDSMPKHTKLCHLNFTPQNIVINDDGTYVLDWVAARQGNASADVAMTYLKLSIDFPQAAELYLDKFCVKSGTAKKYVQSWLPIVAAARLTMAIPEEKELLMKWIDVVDYE